MFDMSFTRRSTDFVSDQTKRTEIPLLCYEEILICHFVLEYATLAINLSQPSQTRPKITDFMGEKQTPLNPRDRATTISLNPPDRATTISRLITIE